MNQMENNEESNDGFEKSLDLKEKGNESSFPDNISEDHKAYFFDTPSHSPKIPQKSSNLSNMQELEQNALEKKYLYHIPNTLLYIYNIKSKREKVTMLETPETLNSGTCMAQLPNGELFCFGRCDSPSGITLVFDRNLRVKILPSGSPCQYSSAIYFNRNVYCFGGMYDLKVLTLSSRFNLDENRWFPLVLMPRNDSNCTSIIFNGNILISGLMYHNLLQYSIDLDSFSVIDCRFSMFKQKILINAGERLYLIECCSGSIYESEIENEYAWKWIVDSAVINSSSQVNCSYYKGEIYIMSSYIKNQYFKFNLNEKVLIELEKKNSLK